MSDNPVISIWSPALIGYAISFSMYGATVGQLFCYTTWFPDDHWLTKGLVFMVFSADTCHLIGSTQLLWVVLVSCHQIHSEVCKHELPWGGYLLVWPSYITFAVQSFYCRRIWTISGRNKFLTAVLLVTVVLGLVFATAYNVDVSRAGTIDSMFTSPMILAYSVASTTCDFLITSAIFKYMWKSGFRRQRTIIQNLAVVCINTGALTCTIAVITGILYLLQGHNFWVCAVGVLFNRSYVNSMLAVLNARKTLRDRDVNVYSLSTLQVPTH